MGLGVGLLHELKRSASPAVWAALEAAHPATYWRLKHARMLTYAKEREVILAPLLCSADTIAVDIGASDGAYTIRLCQGAGRVLAFEARPDQATRLAAMAKANALPVRVEGVALSDRCGTVRLRVPRSDYGRATIEQMNGLDGVADIEEIAVPTRRLDDYDLSGVGFIKIDVEGHELAVLRGAEETLRRSAPVLLVELEDRHHPNAVAEATAFLAGLGYAGYFLTEAGLQSISRFDPAVHQDLAKLPQPPDYAGIGETYFNNFLFCPEDKVEVLRRGVRRLMQ